MTGYTALAWSALTIIFLAFKYLKFLCTWYVLFRKCTGILIGWEWWYGLRNKMDNTSIREGLTSRIPFRMVLSRARWQNMAYFPISDLQSQNLYIRSYENEKGTRGNAKYLFLHSYQYNI